MAEFIAVSALASAVFSQTLARVLDSAKRDKVLQRNHEHQLHILDGNIATIEKYRDAIVLGDDRVANWYIILKDVTYTAMDALDAYTIAVDKKKSSDSADTLGWEDKVKNILYTVSIHLIVTEDGSLRLARTIQTINEKIDELFAEGKKHGYLEFIETDIKDIFKLGSSSTSLRFKDYPILGRDDTTNEIIKRLKSDHQEESRKKLVMLPIVGMGGIGKTTIAQSVYASKEHQFEIKGWVPCSSVNINAETLFREILSEFGNEVASQTPNLQKLTNQLANVVCEKKFLLVIDDVWCKKEKTWDAVLIPLTQGKTGSRLIITTRDLEVVKSIKKCYPGGVDAEVTLHGLKDDHLWEILRDHAFGVDDASVAGNLEAIGKEIVKKLKGLPLAAKAIGRVLGANCSENHWKAVEESNLWGSLTLNGDENLVPALTLSFLHLPSKLKPCFTYLSLLPKGYLMDTTDLVYQWLAHGYLDVKDGASVEDAGAAVIKYLQSMSLLTVKAIPWSRGQYLEMHDLIHDTSQSSGRDDHLQILDSGSGTLEENLPKEKLRHFSYMCTGSKICMRLLRSLESCKKLRTLIFIRRRSYSPDSPGVKLYVSCLITLLKQLECLRVLTLRNLGIEEVPEEIGELKHLRFLDLSHNPIEYLPGALVKLCRLQVLLLDGCAKLSWHSASSNVEVLGQLARLQYLNLSRNKRMEILPECITLLTNLQVLSMNWCRNLKQLPEEVSSLNRLERLELRFSSIGKLPESLVTLSCIRELYLDDCNRLRELPLNFNNLKNLRVLSVDSQLISKIDGIGKLTSLRSLTSFIVKDKEGHKLDELESLNMLEGKFRIQDLVMVKSKTEAQQARLEKKIHLRELILCWKQEKSRWRRREIIRDIQSEEEILENLKPCQHLEALSIQYCMASKLPRWLTGKHFRCLKRLSLNGLQIHVLGVDSRGNMFPCLKFMEISNCPKLEIMPDIPFLENLRLKDLLKLSQWMGAEDKSDGWLMFPRLREITISNCPELKTMPDMPLSLERLTLNKTGVSKLPSLQPSASAAQVLESLNQGFLRTLIIDDCKNLEDPPKNGFKDLKSLKWLEIKRCPRLSKLSTESDVALPPHLEQLTIEECRGIETESLHAESLTSLKDVKLIHFCRHLSPSFLKTVVAPRLKMHESFDIIFDDMELEIYVKEPDKFVPLHIKNRYRSDNEREEGFKVIEEVLQSSPIRKLHIKGIDDLTDADLEQLLRNLTSLKRLKIESCNKVASLPSDMSSLSFLEAIKIESCDHFSQPHEVWAHVEEGKAFLEQNSIKHLSLSKCGQLRCLPAYILLQTLEVWDCYGIQDLSCLSFPLPWLRKLVISGCINLEHPPQKGFTAFESLKILVLLNCPKLSKLSLEDECNLPSSLSRLIIQGCKVSNIENYLRDLTSPEWLLISIYDGGVSDSFVKRMLNERLFACIIDCTVFRISYGHYCFSQLGYYDEFEEEKGDNEYYYFSDALGKTEVSIEWTAEEKEEDTRHSCTRQDLFMEILERIPSDAITFLFVCGVQRLKFTKGKLKQQLLKFQDLMELRFANYRNLGSLPTEDMDTLPYFDRLCIKSCPEPELDPVDIPTYWRYKVDDE